MSTPERVIIVSYVIASVAFTVTLVFLLLAVWELRDKRDAGGS